MAHRKESPNNELYRELVPLADAAAAAYHIIVDRPVPLKDPHALREVRDLVAIALTSVAPVLRQENGAVVPVSTTEVDERLFGRPARLDDLCIRRLDLLRAVESLKEAHGSLHDLQSIRKLA
jgi:hypothetical protein